MISLRSVTEGNIGVICRMRTSEAQQAFVAPNLESLAEAWLHYDTARPFSIYNGETPVGFLMLEVQPGKGTSGTTKVYLWRLMIAEEHQHKHYGTGAMLELITWVKRETDAVQLETSIEKGEGSPEGFYRRLGFELTGEIDDGEHVMVLHLKNDGE